MDRGVAAVRTLGPLAIASLIGLRRRGAVFANTTAYIQPLEAENANVLERAVSGWDDESRSYSFSSVVQTYLRTRLFGVQERSSSLFGRRVSHRAIFFYWFLVLLLAVLLIARCWDARERKPQMAAALAGQGASTPPHAAVAAAAGDEAPTTPRVRAARALFTPTTAVTTTGSACSRSGAARTDRTTSTAAVRKRPKKARPIATPPLDTSLRMRSR